MPTPDRYREMLIELDRRLTAPDPDDHIRRIAREETDKRFSHWVCIGLFCWATATYGWVGSVSVLALGVIFLTFSIWRGNRNPMHERHLVALNAENIARLSIIQEAAAGGAGVWVVKEKEDDAGKRQIVPVGDDRWDSFWERAYNIALELEKLGPRERKKRFITAAQAAREPLVTGHEMAKHNDAELVYWAADALQAH